MSICPLCHSSECSIEYDSTGLFVRCNTYTPCHIGASILYLTDENLKEKLYNKIVEILLRKPYADEHKRYHKFCYKKTVLDDSGCPIWLDLDGFTNDYPKDEIERAENSLLNLSLKFSQPGQCFGVEIKLMRLLYFDNSDTITTMDIYNFLNFMLDLRYLTNLGTKYSISAEGWRCIRELRKKRELSKQGFIAMRFSNETKDISQVFCQSIQESGYAPMRIDEKEHNNQIVPEILYEISKSKFLVIDLTYPNYGAYYEAGYALGLGKEVIACCRKAEFDDPEKKPHFDLYQKNMVVWKDLDDLKDRLTRRIEATVQ